MHSNYNMSKPLGWTTPLSKFSHFDKGRFCDNIAPKIEQIACSRAFNYKKAHYTTLKGDSANLNEVAIKFFNAEARQNRTAGDLWLALKEIESNDIIAALFGENFKPKELEEILSERLSNVLPETTFNEFKTTFIEITYK